MPDTALTLSWKWVQTVIGASAMFDNWNTRAVLACSASSRIALANPVIGIVNAVLFFVSAADSLISMRSISICDQVSSAVSPDLSGTAIKNRK